MTAGSASGQGWSRRYEAVVAVTAAARLPTATKAFCNCAVDSADEPNANTCPVCLGLPGALPVLSERAVDLAVRAALTLGGAVQLVSGFARAHLPPSPERPKGYVVTQRYRPLARRGSVQIGETPEGAPLTADVRCAYLAEDVGRGVHDRFPDASGFDYNLAGAPLLVVEGAAELRSPREARAYVASLARLLRVAGAGRAELDDETLVISASVALRGRGDLSAGVACHVSGFHSDEDVEAAVEAECARQAAVLAAGNTVDARAMLWDAKAGDVVPARAPARDPVAVLVDPDLPPLVLTNEWVDARRRALPELPAARRERFRREYALDEPALDLLTDEPELAEYYESVARLSGDGAGAAAWIGDHAVPLLARERLTVRAFALRVRPADLARLLDARRAGRLTDGDAARVFATMARTGDGVARAARREGLAVPA